MIRTNLPLKKAVQKQLTSTNTHSTRLMSSCDAGRGRQESGSMLEKAIVEIIMQIRKKDINAFVFVDVDAFQGVRQS